MSTIYTYECKICGKQIEREVKAPVPKCPVCNGQMRRKYFPPHVLYRGEGFTGAQSKERKR